MSNQNIVLVLFLIPCGYFAQNPGDSILQRNHRMTRLESCYKKQKNPSGGGLVCGHIDYKEFALFEDLSTYYATFCAGDDDYELTALKNCELVSVFYGSRQAFIKVKGSPSSVDSSTERQGETNFLDVVKKKVKDKSMQLLFDLLLN